MFRLSIVFLAALLALTACSPNTPTPEPTPTPIPSVDILATQVLDLVTPATVLTATLPAPTEVITPAEDTPATPEVTATLESEVTATVEATEIPATTAPAVTEAPAATPAGTEATATASTSVDLQEIAAGLTAPLALVPSPDDTGRLFVVDQIGLIRLITPDGGLLTEPFLDLRNQLVTLRPNYDERGLLALAFHPDFAQNGRLFVYYSAPLRADGPQGWNNTTVLSEFTVADAGANSVDPGSERVILQVDQPQANHEGGALAFGPDGFLYLSLGDGGGANDTGPGHPPMGNGQAVDTLLGSIVRLDIDGEEPYAIPEDNPFAAEGPGRPEIYAWGFRNPYRFSFDMAGNNEMFVADVGQNLYEEVNIVTLGGNYGWNIKEGSRCFDPNNPANPPADCAQSGQNGEPLIDPILEYSHTDIGIAVVGGHVYRGQALPQLQGVYVFGDWSTSFNQADGTLLVATRPQSGDGPWSLGPLELQSSPDGKLQRFVLGFGQDLEGEIYVLTSENGGPSGDTGRVFKLVPGTQ